MREASAVVPMAETVSVRDPMPGLVATDACGTPCPTTPIRRAFDIAGASILLVLLAPVFAVIALAVRTSPGPVIYAQTRVGMNRRTGQERRGRLGLGLSDRRWGDRRVVTCAGRLYRILKFRTMVDGAEATRGPMWAVRNDDRITMVGKLLRRTRLD